MTASSRDNELLPLVRAQVRERLLQAPSYLALPAETRQQIAHDTVKAIHYIVGGADGTSRPAGVELSGDSPITRALAGQALPEGDTAGQRFAQTGAVAARQGSEAFTGMINEVNFPRFVGGLIEGVFNAIVTSSIKQMEAYAELVKNVSKSVDQYMKDNVTENNARDYLADRYPHVFEIDIDGKKPKLKRRDGVDEENLPDFQSDLGMKDKVESLDDDTVEEKIVPAARKRVAMDRQQLLATMVMMGVNRLVVTNGTIEASCMFTLDTTDAVKRKMNQKRTSDWASLREGAAGAEGSYSSEGSGFLGLGDDTSTKESWFTKNSYRDTSDFKVSTTRSEDSEDKIKMHAQLAGKVNIAFKSDYFPMEKMVDVMQIKEIRSKTPTGNEDAAKPAAAGAAKQPAKV
ncbi:MAG: hypothetical protein U1F41_01045 [Burkholderiales bacterium]